MEWLITNSPFIIVIVVLIWAIISAFKAGAIRTFGKIVSAVVSAVLVILISFLVREYFYQEKLVMVLTIVLLFLLAVAFMLFNTFFKPIKALSHLSIVKLVDKPLGIVLAYFETVVLLWAVYCLIMVMNGGAIENWIMKCVENNYIMRYYYNHNLLYDLIAGLGEKIMGHQILAKWILS